MRRWGGNIRARLTLALTGLGLTAVSVSVAAQQSTEDAFDTAFRRMKGNDDLQFDLPRREIEIDDPPELNWLGDLVMALGPMAKFLVYALIGAILLGLAYFIFISLKDIRLSRLAKAGEDEVPLYEPSHAEVATLLGEVDELAAAGRYKEAVHVLLFKAIAQIDRARPGLVRRSLTSREIGVQPGLTGAAKSAFVEIARINESGWFGGQEISRAQFEAARAAYAQFGEDREILPQLSGAPA